MPVNDECGAVTQPSQGPGYQQGGDAWRVLDENQAFAGARGHGDRELARAGDCGEGRHEQVQDLGCTGGWKEDSEVIIRGIGVDSAYFS